jgi:hypothetical protein
MEQLVRVGESRKRRGLGLGRKLMASVLLAFAFAATAQGVTPSEAEAPLVTVENELGGEGAPALFAVGISAGFPSYQTVALAVSLQAQFVGAQLKGSWTPAGAYVGAQLRAYPPIPVPIPLYIGVGGGIYGSNASYHFALGTHVPLGKDLRFDLEGGVANVPQLDQRAWVPHLAVGISYVFPVELAPSEASARLDRGSAPGGGAACTAPDGPDRAQIPAVIEATVNDWILSARATYGSVYTDLRYSYSITRVQLSGNVANVTVNYSGSVREILTGTRQSASGDARVRLVWTGCGWGVGSVEY